MSANDQIILRQIVQQKIDEMESKSTEGEFFERFLSELILKNYNLSYDEIEAGIVDGGNDGGIDAIYVLINGESRGRPASLLKDDKNYTRIFNDRYSINLYWVCAITMKKVDSYMKSKREAALRSEEKYNLVFHVAMYVALVMMGRSDYLPKDIVKIYPDEITPNILAYCLKQVVSVFHRLSEENNRPIDVLAKNRESTNALLKWFEKTFKPQDITAATDEQGDNE